MFKKYFVHEFKNSCKMPITICCVSLFISLLVAIGSLLELDELLAVGLSALVLTVYIFFFMSINSINKTMTERLFTKNGYLTLTLPVGTHTILLSKILINILYVVMYIASFLLGIILVVGGLVGEVDSVIDGVGSIFTGFAENIGLSLIRLGVLLIGFVFVLCGILFYNAVVNSGLIKKQSKVVNFIAVVVFLLLVTTILNIEIIPYALCYEDELGYYFELIEQSDYYFSSYLVVHFSSLFWMVIGTIGFYFGSYYLIKNKIDIL